MEGHFNEIGKNATNVLRFAQRAIVIFRVQAKTDFVANLRNKPTHHESSPSISNATI